MHKAGAHYPSLAHEPLADVLRLIRTPNVGPITFFQLIRRFGSAAAALDALPELSRKGGRARPLVAASADDITKEIEAAEKFGAQLITYGSPAYPALLMAIPDAPPVITINGNASLWQDKPLIAMVGARNASANGCQFAGKLARDLGERGYIVVSGLARGIDSYAHRGALETGTIGVIAGGIDTVYPPENKSLFNDLRKKGAIISEQPFAATPYAASFPGRNRIIAGMTLGTLVVEASPKSGSLITARYALEGNREVFAIPGSPLDPRARGCNQLIKQGAIMVENVEDIIEGLTHARIIGFGESTPEAYQQQASQSNEAELETIRATILEKLGATPVLIDELIEQCHTTATTMLGVLLELELAGRLRRTAGNKVSLALEAA